MVARGDLGIGVAPWLHKRAVSHRTVPITMRSIDLQIVRWRRSAQAPAPARPTAVLCRVISLDGDPRTGASDQRAPYTLLPCAAPWSHAPGSDLLPWSGAGKHTRGRSTTPSRQCGRRAAWWYGPGPRGSAGPSLDGLKTDSTVSMYGRSWPGGEWVRACRHQSDRS